MIDACNPKSGEALEAAPLKQDPNTQLAKIAATHCLGEGQGTVSSRPEIGDWSLFDLGTSLLSLGAIATALSISAPTGSAGEQMMVEKFLPILLDAS